MAIPMFELSGGQLRFKEEARRSLDELLQEVGASTEVDQHTLLGQRIYGPIETLAQYQEWARPFFLQETAEPNEVIRVARDVYTVMTMSVSPDGEFLFNRPGYTFTTISWQTFRVGLEISWRQQRTSGFPLLERKMREVAAEIARARDGVRQEAMDTALGSISGHTSSGAFTKAAVDAILKDARQNGFDITIAAINSGTALAMGDWTVSSTPLWQMAPEGVQEEMLTTLWFSRYGGVNWLASPFVPADKVYFSSGPEYTGWEWSSAANPSYVGGVDIRRRVDLHTWELDVAVHVENPYALYRHTIV